MSSSPQSDNEPPRTWDPNLSIGKRRSAFLPYKPKAANTVLTNLQRGNTAANIAKDICLNFHEKTGQGEISASEVNNDTVDTLDSNQFTPLAWACFYGQLSSVSILLDLNANVNFLGPDFATPLLLAAAGGHHEIVRMLSKKGAVINHMDILGNTALMYAAAGNHPHTCNEILLYRPDITLSNEDGETAYSLAIHNNAHLAQAVLENYISTILTS